MHKIILIAGMSVVLAGCATFGKCPTGQTAVSVDANGNLVYEKVMKSCPPPSAARSIGGPPMAAPPPGQEWWNLF